MVYGRRIISFHDMQRLCSHHNDGSSLLYRQLAVVRVHTVSNGMLLILWQPSGRPVLTGEAKMNQRTFCIQLHCERLPC